MDSAASICDGSSICHLRQVSEGAPPRVVVLGAAYRGGVTESAFSGVFPIVSELEKRGARVSVQDPMYDNDELVAMGLVPHGWGEHTDAVVQHTDHAEYRNLTTEDLPGARIIVDGRAVIELPGSGEPRIIRLGCPQ